MYKTARNLTVLGVGLSASAIVGWLLLREKKREQNLSQVIIKSQLTDPAEVSSIVLPLEELEPETEQNIDDLTQIKDIGARFAKALYTIGITRYAQLATQTPESLAEQLSAYVTVRAERIRSKDWIGQASRLAHS